MPRPLYSRDRPVTHCIGSWVGPRTGGGENLAATGIRSPDRSARSESLYRQSYPGPQTCSGVWQIEIRCSFRLSRLNTGNDGKFWEKYYCRRFLFFHGLYPRVVVKRVGKGKFGSLPVCRLARKTSAHILSSLVRLFTPKIHSFTMSKIPDTRETHERQRLFRGWLGFDISSRNRFNP